MANHAVDRDANCRGKRPPALLLSPAGPPAIALIDGNSAPCPDELFADAVELAGRDAGHDVAPDVLERLGDEPTALAEPADLPGRLQFDGQGRRIGG